MQTITVGVQGMSCGHCVKAVEGAVGKLAGVSLVEVSLENKSTTVTFDESKVTAESIKETIAEQGYDVI
jgi:copper chaperone